MPRSLRPSLASFIPFAAALAVASAFVPAKAAQGAAPAPRAPAMVWIGDLDANHDGKISRQEAAAMPEIAKNFDAIDANHDGFITMSEVKAMWRAGLIRQAQASVQARMAAFNRADGKHEGKINAEQAKAAGMSFVVANFNAIDSNHDGFVDRDEMQKASVAIAQRALIGPREATEFRSAYQTLYYCFDAGLPD